MNKIMEYMFFGLPVVAYDLTEHRVSAGPAALFAEPNRERALACSISELLDDPARRRRMGEVGRERVRTALAWEHSAPVLLAAYDRLWPTPGRMRGVDPDGPPRGCPGMSPPVPRRDRHRRAEGHHQPGGDASHDVGQRVHRLHQAGHRDHQHETGAHAGGGDGTAGRPARAPWDHAVSPTLAELERTLRRAVTASADDSPAVERFGLAARCAGFDTP